MLNEDSIMASKREFKEETGLDIKHTKSISLIENFFTSRYNGLNYHEMLIIHEFKFENINNYNLKVINNIEEKNKDYLSYIWIDINELKKLNFEPKIVLDILDKKDFQHIINKG